MLPAAAVLLLLLLYLLGPAAGAVPAALLLLLLLPFVSPMPPPCLNKLLLGATAAVPVAPPSAPGALDKPNPLDPTPLANELLLNPLPNLDTLLLLAPELALLLLNWLLPNPLPALGDPASTGNRKLPIKLDPVGDCIAAAVLPVGGVMPLPNAADGTPAPFEVELLLLLLPKPPPGP